MCKKLKAIILLLTSFFCIVNGQKKDTSIIGCEEFFKQVYEIGKCKLFDLRSVAEYQKNRLIDSESAETKEKFSILLKDVNKQDKIFIYCEIGKRSIECAKWLKSLGYTNVFQLEGGYNNWKKSGFPIDAEKIK